VTVVVLVTNDSDHTTTTQSRLCATNPLGTGSIPLLWLMANERTLAHVNLMDEQALTRAQQGCAPPPFDTAPHCEPENKRARGTQEPFQVISLT
jgi:hypothetical protein